MLIYSKILSVIGLLNLVLCSGFSLYYNVRPADFADGTALNSLAYLIGFGGFFVMMVLLAVYYALLGEKREDLLTFNPLNITLYIVFTVNLIYRLILDSRIPVSGSATPSKVGTFLALALYVNVTTVTVAINYIKGVKAGKLRE